MHRTMTELAVTSLVGIGGATATKIATDPVLFYQSELWHASGAVVGMAIGVLTVITLVIQLKNLLKDKDKE